MPKLERAEIMTLIEEENWPALRRSLADWPAADMAELLESQLDKRRRVLLFRALPRTLAGEVFSHLDGDDQDALLRDLTDEEARHILAELRPDDRTALLEELPAPVTQRLFALLSPEDLRESRMLLGYPEESVGRLMTPDYVTVREDWTVEEALAHIREVGHDSETLNRIYVTGARGKLIDELRIRQLILAQPRQHISQLMDRSVISISAFADREEAVQVIQHYDLFALPVVDSDGVLVGIVTSDDVLDVAEEEATEDIHLGAAVAPLRASYRDASIWELFARRVPWLLLLVFINLISSGIIAAYEETLAAALALAFFIPLLIDSGGNTGSQAATLMVRALATGDVRPREWLATLSKELMVGLALGLVVALATAGLGLFRGGAEVGLIVGLTMVCIVVAANLIGTLMPLALRLLKIDPAVASSPLITSIADAMGLIIYFSIATAVLGVL